MMPNLPRVITISRQLGSGGAYIGEKLAQQLNMYYADREIINQAAKQLALFDEDIATHDERTRSFLELLFQNNPFITTETYIPPQVLGPTDEQLFETEKEIIEHIAEEQSAVIVGRCGSYILREHPNHVSIFLHANMSFRKNRIQEAYGVSEKEAAKMMAQSDEDRAKYHQTFTNKNWTDTRQYDLCIDTSKPGVDASLDLIVKYLQLV
jgi:cytidylate kinase